MCESAVILVWFSENVFKSICSGNTLKIRHHKKYSNFQFDVRSRSDDLKWRRQMCSLLANAEATQLLKLLQDLL